MEPGAALRRVHANTAALARHGIRRGAAGECHPTAYVGSSLHVPAGSTVRSPASLSARLTASVSPVPVELLRFARGGHDGSTSDSD